MKLKLQISEYEERLALLAQENERLNFMIEKRDQENENISNLKLTIQGKDKKMRELER